MNFFSLNKGTNHLFSSLTNITPSVLVKAKSSISSGSLWFPFLYFQIILRICSSQGWGKKPCFQESGTEIIIKSLLTVHGWSSISIPPSIAAKAWPSLVTKDTSLLGSDCVLAQYLHKPTLRFPTLRFQDYESKPYT